ncbi:Ig-like domain-containing protein, partial [Acinetobacter soli]
MVTLQVPSEATVGEPTAVPSTYTVTTAPTCPVPLMVGVRSSVFTWSFTPSTGLADGAHSITTTATDAAGNTSAASDALNFTVDTTNVVV